VFVFYSQAAACLLLLPIALLRERWVISRSSEGAGGNEIKHTITSHACLMELISLSFPAYSEP
jgi:hypothetical protein